MKITKKHVFGLVLVTSYSNLHIITVITSLLTLTPPKTQTIFETGRGKLNGVHAGLVILTPLGDHPENLETAHSGHTPIDPPPSILNTVYSALKSAFSTASSPTASAPVASYGVPDTSNGASPPSHSVLASDDLTYQPPPVPQSIPDFKPVSWGAVNSYGQPAAVDSYVDYDPRHPLPPFPPYEYTASKRTVLPVKKHKQGLTSEKIQKIQDNIKKLNAFMNQHQRSSEDFKLTDLETYKRMLQNGQIPYLPTPVVTDNEIGVLPAEVLDTLTTTTSTSTTTTTTTEKPKTTTENAQNRRKDIKYYLRGNKIVQV